MDPSILFVDHASDVGGAELSLLDTAMHWAAPLHVALMQPGPFRDLLRDQGVPSTLVEAGEAVLGVRRGGGWDQGLRAAAGIPRLAHQLARLAKGYDVVYANTQKSLIVGGPAAWLAGRPLVWHLHDILSAEHFSAMNRRLPVLVANRFCARVIANSAATAEAFVREGGDPDLVGVVPNGFSRAPFERDSDEEVAELRRRLGLEGKPLAGMFGRLAPWKGQHVFIRAVAAVPGLHAVIVGGALFGEQVYEEELKLLCAELGVRDRVHFLGFRRDIPRLMRMMTLIVHASTAAEPFGRVLVEAMLAGSPLIASRAGGALEIVEDGVTGRLVAPGSVAELRAAMARILAEPGEAAAMADRARRAAVANFSTEVMIDGIRREIGRILPAPEPGPLAGGRGSSTAISG
ncbi:glycosyltransferase family 4 protein (plasmid) [Skermanella sp. TT6]|uniref:Glycosyltransferase family 4 protein n=1 Tax=Skermanella cutis TaxID=2775420 RepID=A0ABX7BGI2_9PROT|nr:glycosyltransferase family 4 protein [Skermanella sp. TT6]QQP93472.1 glycosyltransferase family 4 protein [Skermanella sp. TT6]